MANQRMESTGVGDFTVDVQASNGAVELVLQDAEVLPHVKDTLISLGQLTQQGYEVSLRGEFLKVSKHGKKIFYTKRVGNLYPVLCSKFNLVVESMDEATQGEEQD